MDPSFIEVVETAASLRQSAAELRSEVVRLADQVDRLSALVAEGNASPVGSSSAP